MTTTAPPTPLLAVNNLEVVYHHTIQVLKGLSLSVPEGRIVGLAQMMTVLASAVGPLLLAGCHALTGSYAAVFFVLAGVVVLLAVAAWIVTLPRPVGELEANS